MSRLSLHFTVFVSRVANSWSAAYTAASVDTPESMQLDFTGVDYINSTGIALIVGMLARARAQQMAVRAAGLTEHYRHIFEITRLSDFIEIVQPAPR